MDGQSYPTTHADYPRRLNLDDIRRRTFLFLGEAIVWIICRDQPSNSVAIAEGWDDAERELFDFIDANAVEVRGYRAPNQSRIYEVLPNGIWARMNKDGSGDPIFSPVDDSEEREDGGSVSIGDLKWDGVRLPSNLVLSRWLPSNVSPEAPKPRGRRPRYDWETFTAVAQAKLEEEGAFDPSVDTKWNKASLERYMAGWCRQTWKAEPSESTIRAKLSEIETAYLEGRKGQ